MTVWGKMLNVDIIKEIHTNPTIRHQPIHTSRMAKIRKVTTGAGEMAQ